MTKGAMKMNFKEALIAHLQGEKVEMQTELTNNWMDFGYGASHVTIREIEEFSGAGFMYRLAPRTITVNGVEVPAPESVAPRDGDTYYVPDPLDARLYADLKWRGDDIDERALANGVLYLSTDACIARAKAMLIYK